MMPGRELAFVKDVGFLNPGFGRIPRSVGSGIDLRITESGFTLSPSGETIVLGGQNTTSVSFDEVTLVRIKKDGVNPDWHILTVSMKGAHWWNRREVGKIVLREWQFAQVMEALNSLPTLKGKLSV